MANWYVGSVGYTAVAQWAAATVYAAGAIVRQLASPAVGSERCFRTSAGGTSHATTEPVWSLGQGVTQPTDGTVTWVECTGAEARQAAGAWAAPAARLNSVSKVSYVSAVTVNNQGVATYVVGDTLTAALGTGVLYGDNATFRVATLSSGKVATVTIISGGSYFTSPSVLTGNAVTGGGGTGCTLNLTMSNWAASSDNFYVASNHAETQSTAVTIQTQSGANGPYPTVLCVDETGAGHVPPTAADLKTTAMISTTGNSAMTIASIGYVYGIKFTCGSGANAPALTVQPSTFGSYNFFDACALVSGGTATSGISLNSNGTTRNVFNNTTVQVSATGTTLSGGVIWKNTPSAIQGATLPTILFNPASGVTLDGVDLSALGSGKTLFTVGNAAVEANLFNCKLGASVTIANTGAFIASGRVNIVNCDSGTLVYRTERWWPQGTLLTTTTVVRTSGASDGTTAVAWQITTSSNTAWIAAFECYQIGEWNTVTASNVTCTVYGVINAAAVPNNDEVWLDIEYMGSSSSPQASFASGTKATILTTATAQSADTSAWDSAATSRANSTAYALGAQVKVSSNSGRIFFCSTAGTSSSSLPAGYATAVDGGTVTDGTAVFRAGSRFVMSVTLSNPQPQLVGDLYAIVRIAKASSTVIIDPKLTLS